VRVYAGPAFSGFCGKLWVKSDIYNCICVLSVGPVFSGLRGKLLYPMVSSTAARTGMKLVKACSYATSLQFLCCCVLRRIVPPHLDVTAALRLPPGLHDFLINNLGWLLRPSELEGDSAAAAAMTSRTSAGKRRLGGDAVPSSSGCCEARSETGCKRPRLAAALAGGLSDLDDEEEDDDDEFDVDDDDSDYDDTALL